ncbi:MAG: hypothetical protein ACP5O2_03925 [Bacteroidales bacterium]
MEEKILENLDNPEALELLFRSHSEEFRNALPSVFQKYPDNILLKAWSYRLKSDKKSLSWGTLREQLTLGILVLLFIPVLQIVYFPDDQKSDLFFRNISLIIFGYVSIYLFVRDFFYKHFLWVPFLIFIFFAFYINSNIVYLRDPCYDLIHLHTPVIF